MSPGEKSQWHAYVGGLIFMIMVVKITLEWDIDLCERQYRPGIGVQFSRSVVPDSLRPHGLQHARPPCLSPT